MNLQNVYDDDLTVRISEINNFPGVAESVQTALADLGMLDPPADGRFGPLSRLALRRFVELVGVGDPLVIDKVLARELLDATADTLLPVALGSDLASRIVKAMQAKKYWFARLPGYVNIVYVEGANEDGSPNANKRNHFNDRRVIITMSGGRPKIIGNWQSTTEPGAHYTAHPPNSLGVGRIGFGQYRAWRRGMHVGLSGQGGHMALVQEVSVKIYRDKNKDFKREGDLLDTNNDGFNQHHGYDQSEENIGAASAGCLVGRTKSGHKQFMALVESDPRYLSSGGYMFWTTVMPVGDLG